MIYDFIRNRQNFDQLLQILNQAQDETTIFVIFEYLNKVINSD